jgi:hypothetical protein
MCGRYRLSRREQIIEEHFDTADWQDDWSPRYNIAPTQPVPVIRQHPKELARQISTMCWGLLPPWEQDASGAARAINPRSETAATKPTFRDPLRLRRCLIPGLCASISSCLRLAAEMSLALSGLISGASNISCICSISSMMRSTSIRHNI